MVAVGWRIRRRARDGGRVVSEVQTEYEQRRAKRIDETEHWLTVSLDRYADPPRSQYIALMRRYLRETHNPDKCDIGGRLVTLQLPIWRLPTDRAIAWLRKMERKAHGKL